MNTSASSEMVSPLQRFVSAHPWLFAVAWVAIIFPIGWLISHLLLLIVHSVSLRFVIYETGLIVVAFVFISRLHWWDLIGFRQGFGGKNVVVCLFPAFLIISIAWGGLSQSTVGAVIFFLAFKAFLIAVAEETIFRGIVLQLLLPKGVLRAVFASTFLFAVLHVSNLFAGLPWEYVVGQVLYVFGGGLAFAVMRVRTGSIWPGIILHAFTDFGAFASIAETGIKPQSLWIELIAGGIICFVYLIYAAIALRDSKLEELRVHWQAKTLPIRSRGRVPLNDGSDSPKAAPKVSSEKKQHRPGHVKSHQHAVRNRHH